MEESIPEGFAPFGVDKGFANHIGPLYWKLSSDAAEMGFRVLPHHLNPAGICHGGVMMTVADMAVGFAVCWTLKATQFLPSINNTVDFLGMAREGDWLETKTDVIKTTKRMGFAQGVLSGPDGAVMRFNGICKIASANDPRFQSTDFAAQMRNLFAAHS